MKERFKQVLERIAAADGKLSRKVVTDAIGEAVLALLEAGRDCDRAALLAWFDDAISALPPGFRRQRCEDSQAALRDAMTKAGR